MPRCSTTKSKSWFGRFFLQFLHEQLPHLANAHAHAGQFFFPQLAQFRRGQRGGDHLAAMRSAGWSSWCG